MGVKKKSIIYIVLMFSLLAFASGCTQQTAEVKEESVGTYFVGGTSGLDVRFAEGEPPTEFYENESIPISIILENKGETDVVNPKVFISGVPPSAWEDGVSTSKQLESTLEGISKFGETTTPGGQTDYTFGNVNFDLPITTGSISQRTYATACYNYSTDIVTSICMKQNIAKQVSGREVCELSGARSIENSAAPIQVTTVREEPRSRNQVSITFIVENKGSGDVYWTPGELDCNTLTPRDIDKVKVSSINLGAKSLDNGITCNGLTTDNLLRMSDGVGTFVCHINVLENEEYLDLLTMTLDYGYSAEASKTLKILAFE